MEPVERDKSDVIDDLMRAYKEPSDYTPTQYVELLEELICFVAGIPRRDIMD